MPAVLLTPLLLVAAFTPARFEPVSPRPSRVVVDHAGSGDFRTIQEGVDAVAEGGVVSVLHGDYEGFLIDGKAVRVLGTPPVALADDVRTTITTPLVVRGLAGTQMVVVTDVEAFNTGGNPFEFPVSYQLSGNAGPVFLSHTFLGAFEIEDCAFVSIHRHVLGGRLECTDSNVFVGESRIASEDAPAVFVDGGSVALNDVIAFRNTASSTSLHYPFPVVVTGGATFYHDRTGNLVAPEPGLPEVLILDGVERIGGFNYMDLEYSDGTQITMRAIADRDGLYAASAVSLFRGAPLATEFGEYWLDPGSARFLTDRLLDGSSFPFHFELDAVVPIPDGLRPSRLTSEIRNNAPGANPLLGIPYVLQGLVVGPDGVPVLTPPAFGVL